MKAIFDDISIQCSKITTQRYSTSFSSGIRFLDKGLHAHIYAIYGFVRYADEIVDSFHDYDKAKLFAEYKTETWKAIARKISINPILNSFQHTVRTFAINHELIEHFFESMETDLQHAVHTEASYSRYIYGSAESVGLMCLKVFTGNDPAAYEELKYPAMKLGAAFQKVNFLRDMQADHAALGRIYFPGVDFNSFSDDRKRAIENDIEEDFREALVGIKALPAGAKKGVYLAYCYYRELFLAIKRTRANALKQKRIRVPEHRKLILACSSALKNKFNLL